MDSESELARFKWVIAGVALFLLSGCLTWSELVHLVTAKSGQAKVGEVYKVTKKRMWLRVIPVGERSYFASDCTFTDGENNPRKHELLFDEPPTPGGTVAISYTNGKDGDCRKAGDIRWWAIGLFVFALGWLGWFGWRLLQEARDDPRPRRK